MNIYAKQFRGRSGPNMALEIDVTFEWHREPSFFLGLTGQATHGNAVVSDIVLFQKTYWGDNSSGNTLITQDKYAYGGKLVIPVQDESIRHIEDSRNDQDISLRVDLNYMWQEAIPAPVGNDGQPRFLAGAVRSNTTNVYDCIIKRSDWLKRLAEMKWQEYQSFEVAKQPLLADQNLAVALKRLEEAQTSLRSGDYSGVLTKCRAAFESAAKYEATGAVKEGFMSLLARAFKDDDTKQSAVNGIIASLSQYAHIGRHEQYPAIHIAREEAEFVFTASVSLFSLLSRRLADKS